MAEMNAESCVICGGPSTVRSGADWDYTTESGLDPRAYAVCPRGITIRHCETCVETPGIPNVRGLHFTIAFSLILDAAPLDGIAVRFLRKACGLTQVEFSRHMGISSQHLWDWETGKAQPPRSTRLAACLAFLRYASICEELGPIVSDADILESLRHIEVQTEQLENQDRSRALIAIEQGNPPRWKIRGIEHSSAPCR